MRYEIRILPAHEAPDGAAAWPATHLLSLVRFRQGHEPRLPADRMLVLPVADALTAAREGAPTRATVEAILAFGRALPDGARLVVSCEAGSSRSGAAALMLMTQEVGIAEACRRLHLIRPQAHPNEFMVALGDQALGLGGALLAVVPALHAEADDYYVRRLEGRA